MITWWLSCANDAGLVGVILVDGVNTFEAAFVAAHAARLVPKDADVQGIAIDPAGMTDTVLPEEREQFAKLPRMRLLTREAVEAGGVPIVRWHAAAQATPKRLDPRRTVIKWRLKRTPGGWIDVDVFHGTEGHTLQSAGHIMMGVGEYQIFVATIRLGVEQYTGTDLVFEVEGEAEVLNQTEGLRA